MRNNRKVAVVTGGSAGIGRACALRLAADGWDVIVTARREAELQQTCALGEVRGSDAQGGGRGRLLSFAADVTCEQQVDALFAFVRKQFGRLDLVFNNAGCSLAAQPLEEVAVNDWRRVMEVNVTGTFLCTRAAIRQMKDQQPAGGRIINNGSVSAQVPRPQAAAYTASKHAITGLTRSTALEGRGFGITCSQIDIGNTATEMTGGMAGGVLQPDGQCRAEPTFAVEHVASTVAHLASLPADVTVLFTTILATEMPFVGRG